MAGILAQAAKEKARARSVSSSGGWSDEDEKNIESKEPLQKTESAPVTTGEECLTLIVMKRTRWLQQRLKILLNLVKTLAVCSTLMTAMTHVAPLQKRNR